MNKILYLHGFHSSPNSAKAVEFSEQIEKHFPNLEVIAPQVPTLPDPTIKLIDELLQDTSDVIGVIGSSLGGFLSTYIHNKFKLPAVLINPAVRPFELLHDLLGAQTHPITGEEYELTEQHMAELKGLYQTELRKPEHIWLLQQEKDEVLDYRQALDKYQDCKVTFELGGSHAFEEFQRYPLEIVKFLQSCRQNAK